MHFTNRGILVVIEGIDGSGKSTLAKNLYNRLLQSEIDTVLTKEPGGTYLGSQLRLLLQNQEKPFALEAEFLLFAADRAQHMQELIIPSLAKHKIIISDRMSDSSLVYQGYGKGVNKDIIQTINTWIMNSIKPDLTLYIKIPIASALERIKRRNKAAAAFETYETQEFLEKVLHGFNKIYHQRPDVLTVDGTQKEDEITDQVYTFLQDKFFEKKHAY